MDYKEEARNDGDGDDNRNHRRNGDDGGDETYFYLFWITRDRETARRGGCSARPTFELSLRFFSCGRFQEGKRYIYIMGRHNN